MQFSEQPVLHDLVLVGGGHSHVDVLRLFAMKPEPGLRITVICTDIETPYSCMLPGYVAGHYNFDEVHIDLGRLAALTGARLYRDEVIGINRQSQHVVCRHRPPVAYDLLSINIGSAPRIQQIEGVQNLAIPIKPIAQFNRRWLQLLTKVRAWRGRMTVVVVGGGAGGVELLLAMQYRLRHELKALGRNPEDLKFVLLTAGDTILPTHSPGVRERFMHVLRERNVEVHTQAEVVQISPGCVHTQNGRTFDADETMWVTQTAGPAWLQSTGLMLDANGFIQVNAQLQTLTDPKIFAAGDIANFSERPLEKSAVFAVRMGKPLAINLRRSLHGERLLPYKPQPHGLALISTGNRFAVASRGPLGFSGAWVWQWKNRIDRQFMRRFNTFAPMPQTRGTSLGTLMAAAIAAWRTPKPAPPHLQLNSGASVQALSALAPRGAGASTKVDANIFSRVLGSLQTLEHEEVLIGRHEVNDTAVLKVPSGKAVVQTVDFCRSFIDDPYLLGQITANHTLGHIDAMGAKPQAATAICTVPPGLDVKIEDLLLQMMSGAVQVLNAAGCPLVGGHTGEGCELALGFAINGLIDDQPDRVMRKSGMQPGDILVLTKPIGTGTLLAANARGAARGRWIDEAVRSMLVPHQIAAQILSTHGTTACTDVSGFGLLGHLVEMTRSSGVHAELHLSALPLLDGALDCAQAGILRALQASNMQLRNAVRHPKDFVQDPRYRLLFDPQTAGGLLASVPAAQVAACMASLRAAGYAQAAIIGQVNAQSAAIEPVILKL